MTAVDDVAEPFRSDELFWRSVCASADALGTLLLAIVAAVSLRLTVGGFWVVLPFAVPAVFLLRAAITGRASARSSRAAFTSPDEWRDAERQAVAQVFGRLFMRNRIRRPHQHKQDG